MEQAPGPRVVVGHEWILEWPDGFESRMPSEEAANLLGAAGEMLEALERAASDLETCMEALGKTKWPSDNPGAWMYLTDTFDQTHAAIAKVKGEGQ